MRVLFLTQTFPRFDTDTAGPFIRDLALGLVAGGDEVHVLTPHAPEVESQWEVGGVTVESFRYAPERAELVGYSRSLNADEKIRPGAGWVAPLYLAGARRAVARALQRTSYDLLQAHWVVPNALPAARFSHRLPVAVGLHGSDVFVAEKPAVRRWVGKTLRRVDVLTGCSPELVERVCRLGFPQEWSHVIPYGVDHETFQPGDAAEPWRERLGIPADAVVALSVGRMVTKKGYQVLLPELAGLLERFPKLHVVLAGTGDRLEEFRAATAQRSSRVHLPGIVLRDSLPDLYRSADLFVLPAVHDAKGNVDGLPNVILEAMATGLPVVATGISGIPLAIDDGVQGRLVPEGDGEALAVALAELVADAERRRGLGAAARQRVERELTWRAVANRYREAYEDGLARRSMAS